MYKPICSTCTLHTQEKRRKKATYYSGNHRPHAESKAQGSSVRQGHASPSERDFKNPLRRSTSITLPIFSHHRTQSFLKPRRPRLAAPQRLLSSSTPPSEPIYALTGLNTHVSVFGANGTPSSNSLTTTAEKSLKKRSLSAAYLSTHTLNFLSWTSAMSAGSIIRVLVLVSSYCVVVSESTP